jgi:hypothetical protein
MPQSSYLGTTYSQQDLPLNIQPYIDKIHFDPTGDRTQGVQVYFKDYPSISGKISEEIARFIVNNPAWKGNRNVKSISDDILTHWYIAKLPLKLGKAIDWVSGGGRSTRESTIYPARIEYNEEDITPPRKLGDLTVGAGVGGAANAIRSIDKKILTVEEDANNVDSITSDYVINPWQGLGQSTSNPWQNFGTQNSVITPKPIISTGQTGPETSKPASRPDQNIPVLNPPILSVPGSVSEPGDSVDTLSPTFEWSGDSNADYYALYISKYPYGTANIIFDSVKNSGPLYGGSFNLPSGHLQEGMKYRWNMKAHSSSGWSSISNTLYFQTSTSNPIVEVDPEPPQNEPANPPSINSPGSGSEPGDSVDTLTPTFDWSGDSNADYHALYISKYPYGSANIIFDSTKNSGPLYGGSFNLPSGYLQGGMKYRWNMKAHSSSGWSSISNTLYFQTSISGQNEVKFETPQDTQVTLTLYVHEGSKSGPVIPGATVIGQDGSGNSFSGTADVNGIVTLTGIPGTWYFTASASGYVDNPWDQSITSTCTKHAFIQKVYQEPVQDNPIPDYQEPPQETYQAPQVTLTLYVHEGSRNGPVIPGASVTGQDGSGNSFSGTADGNGIVTLTGTSGTWSFTASASGYEDNPWDQSISSTCTKHAFVQKIYQEPVQIPDYQEPPQETYQAPQVTLTLYVHEGSRNGPVIPGASVTGQDGSGNSFSGTADGNGIVTLTGTPGTWSFTASASGYVDNPWDQAISSTCTKHAFLQK